MFTSSLDTCFRLLDTKTRPQHIAALAIAEGIIPYEKLNERLFSLLPTYPKLRDFSKNEGMEPYSVKYIQCAESISEHVEDVMMRDDLSNEKKWNIYLLHKIQDDTVIQSGILFKLHHSLADGVTGLAFFHHLLFDTTQKEKEVTREYRVLCVIKEVIKECSAFATQRCKKKQESRSRNILFFSIPIADLKSFNARHKISVHQASIFFTSLFYKEIYPNSSYVNLLIPVTKKFINSIGVLGNFIGASRLRIPLVPRANKSFFKEEIAYALRVERWITYYVASKFLHIISKFFPSCAARISHWASSRVDAIATSLSYNRSSSFCSLPISMEYVIPALMPGQQIGFGFMKTREYLNITIIADTNAHISISSMTNALQNQGLRVITPS